MTILKNFDVPARWSNPDGTLTERARGFLRALFQYIGANTGVFPVDSIGGDGASTDAFFREDGTFTQVNLAEAVTGVLPLANGGFPLSSGTSGGVVGFTGASTLASSVALTANALVLGGGAGATPTPMGSLGTTTTLLHGNASGAPTFGAVVLTTDVSGVLSIANGGCLAGVYTPTLTNVANLAASTAYQCQYMRAGSVVTVSGKVDVDPNLAATSTQLGISLPIASAIAAAEDCAGVAFASGIAAQGAAILGDAANGRAQMQWVSGDITNQPMYFIFSYRVI